MTTDHDAEITPEELEDLVVQQEEGFAKFLGYASWEELHNESFHFEMYMPALHVGGPPKKWDVRTDHVTRDGTGRWVAWTTNDAGRVLCFSVHASVDDAASSLMRARSPEHVTLAEVDRLGVFARTKDPELAKPWYQRANEQWQAVSRKTEQE